MSSSNRAPANSESSNATTPAAVVTPVLKQSPPRRIVSPWTPQTLSTTFDDTLYVVEIDTDDGHKHQSTVEDLQALQAHYRRQCDSQQSTIAHLHRRLRRIHGGLEDISAQYEQAQLDRQHWKQQHDQLVVVVQQHLHDRNELAVQVEGLLTASEVPQWKQQEVESDKKGASLQQQLLEASNKTGERQKQTETIHALQESLQHKTSAMKVMQERLDHERQQSQQFENERQAWASEKETLERERAAQVEKWECEFLEHRQAMHDLEDLLVTERQKVRDEYLQQRSLTAQVQAKYLDDMLAWQALEKELRQLLSDQENDMRDQQRSWRLERDSLLQALDERQGEFDRARTAASVQLDGAQVQWEQERDVLRKQFHTYVETIDSLKEQLNHQAESHEKELERFRLEHRTTVHQYEAQLDDKRQKARVQQSENQVCYDCLKFEYQKENQSLRDREEALSGELSEKTAKLENAERALHEERTSLQNALNERSAELQTALREIEMERDRLADVLAKERSELLSRIASQKSAAASLRSTYQIERAQMEQQFQDQFNQLEKERQQQVQELRESAQALEESLQRKFLAMKVLQERLDHERVQTRCLEEKEAVWKEQANAWELQRVVWVQEFEAQRQEYQQQIKTLENQLVDEREGFERKVAEHRNLYSQLHAQRLDDTVAWQTREQELRQQLVDRGLEIEERQQTTRQERHRLQASVDKLREEHREAVAAIETEHGCARASLQQEREDLQTELAAQSALVESTRRTLREEQALAERKLAQQKDFYETSIASVHSEHFAQVSTLKSRLQESHIALDALQLKSEQYETESRSAIASLEAGIAQSTATKVDVAQLEILAEKGSTIGQLREEISSLGMILAESSPKTDHVQAVHEFQRQEWIATLEAERRDSKRQHDDAIEGISRLRSHLDAEEHRNRQREGEQERSLDRLRRQVCSTSNSIWRDIKLENTRNFIDVADLAAEIRSHTPIAASKRHSLR